MPVDLCCTQSRFCKNRKVPEMVLRLKDFLVSVSGDTP